MEPELGSLETDTDLDRPERRGRPGCMTPIAVLLLLAGAAVGAWWQRDAWRPAICAEEVERAEATAREACPAPGSPALATTAADDDATPELAEPEEPDGVARARAAWTAATGTEPALPAGFADAEDCRAADAELRRLAALLDERAPAAGLAASADGSYGLITRLASGVAVAPPDPSPVLQDIDALLGNLFYAFRSLDPGDRAAAQRLALADDALVEPVALATYRWLASRERCGGDATPRVDRAVLGKGAAFLLESFGGRALLSRRDPRIETLATFYAVAELDHLDRAGRQPHRLDLHAHALRARALLAGADLALRDAYVAHLDGVLRRVGPPVSGSGS